MKKIIVVCICCLFALGGNVNVANADETQNEITSDITTSINYSEKTKRGPFEPYFAELLDLTKGSYRFEGNTLGGTVYTNKRFKGKTTYQVEFSEISSPLTVTVWKKNNITNYRYYTSFDFSSSEAFFSFRMPNAGDQFYLSFSSADSSHFSGYIR